MGPLLDWIKWYQEADLRKQENDLRAVALQNQKMELDYNAGRQKAAIATEEQANKPLYTTQGETISSGGTRPSEGKPEVSSYTPPPTPGPSANQMKAVGADVRNIPASGLSQMGMVPAQVEDYIQVGNAIIKKSTEQVIYKGPPKARKIEYEYHEGADGFYHQFVKSEDLPDAMEQGDIPKDADLEQDPENPGQVSFIPAQKGYNPPSASESGVVEKNLPTDIPVSKVQLPPGAAPAQPRPSARPTAQPQAEKSKQPILPGFKSTGIKARVNEKTPHNELDSMTNTVYPGKSWAELGPKEKDAVLKTIETLHKRQTKGADSTAEREHMGSAYKSAYTLEMRNLMAKYKLMPNDAAVASTDFNAIISPTVVAKLTPAQYNEYEAEAKEIYDKTMGKWYKLYNIEPPKRGLTPPADVEGGGSSSYVRDKSGKLVPSAKK